MATAYRLLVTGAAGVALALVGWSRQKDSAGAGTAPREDPATHHPQGPTANQGPTYAPPSISCENRPADEKIDPATINPDKKGYVADLDGDRTPDFAIMIHDTLYFSKGTGDGRFLDRRVPIVVVKGGGIAYRIEDVNKDGKADLVFFDKNSNGYHQRNMGTTDRGLPYFGDAEVIDFSAEGL